MSSPRPKLLFITRKWAPAVGGMETYSHKMAENLGQHTELTLKALPGQKNGAPPRSIAILLFGVKTAISTLFTRSKPDIIFAGDLALWPLIWLAGLRAPKAVKVLTVHGTDIAFADREGLKSRIYAAYLKLGAKALKRAVTLTNSHATAAKATLRRFRNIAIVPLAGDAPEMSEIELAEPYILYVGRLNKRKGCAWFIKNVLPKLPSGLTLKAAGTIVDDAEEDAVNSPRVKFLGPVYGRELASLRARATAVIVPNIDTGPDGFEGFGLTAPEGAMAGGIVLAANLHGISDAVIDCETGFLLPAGDAQAWADKLIEISNWSAAERTAFTTKARKSARDYYSWARVTNDTLAAIKAHAPNA